MRLVDAGKGNRVVYWGVDDGGGVAGKIVPPGERNSMRAWASRQSIDRCHGIGTVFNCMIACACVCVCVFLWEGLDEHSQQRAPSIQNVRKMGLQHNSSLSAGIN